MSLLEDLETSGASGETAGSSGRTGVPYSEYAAEAHRSRLLDRAGQIGTAAAETGLPPALIAAVASRETGAGLFLDVMGRGDGGHAFGDLQIDYRYHRPDESEGPSGLAHYRQAAALLAELRDQVAEKTGWSAPWALRGAVAAYNAGINNVATQERLDVGTTGNDYSSDVWARARYLQRYFPDSSNAVASSADAEPDSGSPRWLLIGGAGLALLVTLALVVFR